MHSILKVAFLYQTPHNSTALEFLGFIVYNYFNLSHEPSHTLSLMSCHLHTLYNSSL